MKLTSLLIATVSATTVMGGIFPTRPVASTVWDMTPAKGKPKADKEFDVEWKDGADQPPLDKMGECTISLNTGPNLKQIRVIELQKDVKPTLKKIKAKIPADFKGPAGAFYFLEFQCGLKSWYTTRFDIKGISGEIKGFDPKGNLTGTGEAPPPAGSPSPASSAADGKKDDKDKDKKELPAAAANATSTTPPPEAVSAASSVTMAPLAIVIASGLAAIVSFL
jgi:hypothetical protein